MNTEQDKVEAAFYNTIKKYKMNELMQNSTVISAFSGGADSVCMLYLLHKYCINNNINLVAAHVNHMIRGAEADSDEQFCRDFADKLGVKIFVKRIDVPKMSAESGRGLEETARIARYGFFDELAGKFEKSVIATAHSSSDNCETVIFNLMRGCGTHGLTGITPVRDNRFIRPLIESGGREIREFCRNHGLDYVIDKTNNDTDYTRNYIRHEIMPQLGKINAEPERAVTKMTRLVMCDDDFILSCAREKLGNNDYLSRTELNELHPAVSSRMIMLLYDKCKITSSTIEERHIAEILRLSAEKSGESRLSLPGGMTAIIGRSRIIIEPDRKSEYAEKSTDDIEFKYPADGDFFENKLYRVEFSQSEHNYNDINYINNENIYKLSILRTFCFDKIKDTLVIRYRREGDSYVSGGMRRKVKKLFIDKKMTSEEKSLIPIICDGDGILWIPGFPPRDGTASPDDENSVTVCVRYKNPEK